VNKFLAALTVVVLSVALSPGAAQAATAHLSLTDFENSPRLARTGENVNELSQVTLSGEQAHSGKTSAKLDYTFVVLQGGRQYVGVGTPLTFLGTPTEFSVWVYGDGVGNVLRLRLRDKSGEIFQYNIGTVDWKGWRQMTASLAKPAVSWGGNADGKVDLPLELESVLLDSEKRPSKGVLYFDDLSYTAELVPTELVSIGLDAKPFGAIYWGSDTAEPPALVARNLSTAERVEAKLDLKVTGPQGRVLLEQPVKLSLTPGASQRLPLTMPADFEGLATVSARIQIRDDSREITTSFARLAHPADMALNPDSFFGACTHFGQHKGDLPRSFDLLSKAGIKWLRDEISWGVCETTKGEFAVPEWYDQYMREAVRHGVTPFILFDYGNRFYDEGLSPASAEAQEAFGKYCFGLVSHFKDLCKHWEVYNEPNIGFWKPKPDPEAYSRLLKIAYEAAKKADPTCTVVGVCTAGTDLRYIEEVLKRGGMDYMDALSIHPYRYPRSPEDSNFIAEVTRAHELMARYGGGNKKLWLTEIGWPTQKDPRGVTEEVSGNYLIRMNVQALSLPFVERVIWYDFQNDGFDEKYNEHNFGLIRWQSFTPKQNYIAAKMLTEHLTNATFKRRLLPTDEKDRRYCYEFEKDGKPVLVAWCAGQAGTLSVKLGTPTANLAWADARRETRTLVNETLTLALTDMPVFITGDLRGVKVAQGPFDLRGPSVPLAPGERGELRATVPAGMKVQLTADPGLPLRELVASERLPGVFRFRVRKDAEPTTGKVIARFFDSAGHEQASAAAGLQIVDPYLITLGVPGAGPGDTLAVPVRITNNRDLPWDVLQVSVDTSGGATLARDSRKPLARGLKTLALPATVSFPAARGESVAPLDVTVRVGDWLVLKHHFEVGLYRVPYAPATPDGQIAPGVWSTVPPVALGQKSEDFYPLREGAWKGPEDLSATLQLLWDDQALHVRVCVTDDKHVQNQHGVEVWQSDNVQLAFDGGLRAWQARQDGKSLPFTEIGLTRTDTGDEVYRWLTKEGPVPGIRLKTDRQANLTTYEASIPWSELGATTPHKGDLAGFALIVNEDDGEGRDGWLRFHDGIGVGKDPSRFGVLRFE
jgi:hypothetical protein